MDIDDLLNIKILACSAIDLLKSVVEIQPRVNDTEDSTTFRHNLLVATIACECAIRELHAIVNIAKDLLNKPPPYATVDHRALEMKIRCQKAVDHGIESEMKISSLHSKSIPMDLAMLEMYVRIHKVADVGGDLRGIKTHIAHLLDDNFDDDHLSDDGGC